MATANYIPIANTYFSGMGIGDAGILRAGVKIGQSFELDSKACEVYRANLGNHMKQCDIAHELVLEQDSCDAMGFTYPCTKYSSIADIHGTRTGDELYLHALRHMAIAQPELFWLENVPGMRKFPIVMEAMTKLPDYYIQMFCPIQSSTWLPQSRNRLIIFATRKPFNFSEPETNKRTRLKDILEREPSITLPKAIATRMQGGYRDRPIISDPNKDDIAPTCVAHYAKDKSTRLVKDNRFPLGVRPYSVREYARLQGVEDWFRFNCNDTAAYRGIGNGVSEPVGHWIGQQVMRYFNRNNRALSIDKNRMEISHGTS
ncbi:DNA cytosine methyltransferase [Aliamphritea ceti]|uniref:DNA cytosine methyltransferase n=1 Tax=Aliamphritea ceti TaxID=1524258 RepID=UPI0021C29391|nr:DNA cytosine methyltransferase [Aliamphritea ceti]